MNSLILTRWLLVLAFGALHISTTFAQSFMDVVEDLLDEPQHFEDRTAVLQLTSDLFPPLKLKQWSLDVNQIDVKTEVPPLTIGYEKQVYRSFGVGAFVGFQSWKVPILKYHYRYYIGGLRLSHHFAVGERLDPYVGMAPTYRRLVLTNGERPLGESTVTFHFFAGARYYFTERLGAVAEVGDDAMGWVKLGLSYYLL